MEIKPISVRVKDSYDIALTNRGSTGLSIQWEISDGNIATVTRSESTPLRKIRPGDSIQTTYTIQFHETGRVKINFYESRIWDDSFPKTTLAQLEFNVS